MLTKTLRFDDDVLWVLRQMLWKDDGRLGMITVGELPKDEYQRLNKALEAMGGKWNRSKGGHVFASDPRPMVEGLLNSGALTVARDGFFETPAAVTARMLELLPIDPHGDTLEPEAGNGAIARILRPLLRQPDQLLCIEKNEQRAQELRKQLFNVRDQDFLTYAVAGWQRIYMNPPFEEGQDTKHVAHAYNLLSIGGGLVSVMGEHAFFADDIKSRMFRDWLVKVGGKSEELPEKSFHASGTDVNTRLVVIRK
jgi:hypothetical protein